MKSSAIVKRVSILATLLMACAASLGGCRAAAPALEGLGGRDCQHCGSFGDKNRAIVSQWGRDMRKNERLFDQYLFNYDINDPYRGDCLVGY